MQQRLARGGGGGGKAGVAPLTAAIGAACCPRCIGGEASGAALAGQLVTASIEGARSTLAGTDWSAGAVAVARQRDCKAAAKASKATTSQCVDDRSSTA
jgi:hypothetical protein